MCNKIAEVDENLFDSIENGMGKPDDWNEEEDGEYEVPEIYQYYIISQGGADYLKRVSKEIVLYSELLDCYVWGITHFGTSWDWVETEIKN